MTKTANFLARIGLNTIQPEHTIEFLTKVQEACVRTIPYENLDIIKGIPLSLTPESIYEKIVDNHRGGYCFEVNALLHDMLDEMGFTVRSCFARFLRGETKVPFRRHRIVVVTLGEAEYLVDIGVGQIAPRSPLRLMENEVQQQNGETYRFERDEKLGWVLLDLYKGEWRKYISFTPEHQYDVDFVPASFWCEKHPDSPFNKSEMIAIKTDDGRKTVDGHTYKVFKGTELVYIEENVSDVRLVEILRTEFGLEKY